MHRKYYHPTLCCLFVDSLDRLLRTRAVDGPLEHIKYLDRSLDPVLSACASPMGPLVHLAARTMGNPLVQRSLSLRLSSEKADGYEKIKKK